MMCDEQSTDKGDHMTDTIVGDKRDIFKDLEKEIYRIICRKGVEITRTLLEEKDAELMEARDRRKYRDKGKRKTTIKTVYGDVTYRRHVYETVDGEGKKGYAYLLDEALGTGRIGLVSLNLAEKIADAATEMSYREAASMITETTGERISASGAWGLMQGIGERIGEEENLAVRQMEAGQTEGDRAVPVLFEEMDGVWVRAQGPHHEKKPMQEIKASTTYEGWDAEGEKTGRSRLIRKRSIAGIVPSADFHEKREADIRSRYDADGIGQRVLNGDGGSWIGDPYDPEAIVQLDPFHVGKEIIRCIADPDARTEIQRRLSEKDVEGALSYISIYADSIDRGTRDDRAGKARELYRYLWNNRDCLIPWRERGIRVQEPPKGTVYKDMGVQEGQNCTVYTLRMKHRRMRWSEKGGDNMVKALYRKENGELHATVGRYGIGLSFPAGDCQAREILSAAKAPKKDGKGDPYIDRIAYHMPILDAALTEGRKVLRRLSF